MSISKYKDLFIGSVFTVQLAGERGRYTKVCPAYAVDVNGHDAIFHPNTPIRLCTRVKCSVVDFS